MVVLEMIKPNKLKKGDKVAIISLSSGIIGEKSTTFQVKLGLNNLISFGLKPIFMPNALKGIDYLDKHPEKRAEDLKAAFNDNSVKAIFCAIGGIDTFRTVEYLLTDKKFIYNVKHHPKIFMGFSDTTINHLMFYQLGLTTYYGPSFLNDLAETKENLLPYTKMVFNQLFNNPSKNELISSKTWYEERTDFSKKGIEKKRISHREKNGYIILRGNGKVQGNLFGGCLESLTDLLTDKTFPEEQLINSKFKIFPKKDNFKNIILFIETSENLPSPETYEKLLKLLLSNIPSKEIKAIMVGKPQNEKYFEDYQSILLKTTEKAKIPVIYNVNFGHAYPRTIIPYGLIAEVDFDKKKIEILEKYFDN